MRKLFTLNLWPTEEMKKKKQFLAAQQGQGGAAGNVVVDGVDGGDGQQRPFGIRSYLHQFYFLSSPNVEEVIAGGEAGGKSAAWYLLPPPPSQRMGLHICRLMTLLGVVLLLGGAGGIVAGYCWPRSHASLEQSLMRIAIDQDEEGNFYIPPERLAELLRDPMHTVKLSAFCVFAIGASVMAIGLLLPTFAHCMGGSRLAAFASEDTTPNEAPVRVYPTGIPGSGQLHRVPSPTKPVAGQRISPTGPVPVMEELAKVQPAGARKTPSPIGGSPADDLLGRDHSPLLQQR
jgi:hypothetical protein